MRILCGLGGSMLEDLLEYPRLKAIYELSKTVMGRDPVHGWPHVERVLGLVLKISMKYRGKIDLEALIIATLLHDIGRQFEEDYGEHHAIIGARLASHLLAALGYNKGFIDKVEHIILSHSFSLGIRAKTLEAMILSDADKLDAIGAIGIVRAFMLGGERRETINEKIKHFHEKLLKLKELLYLDESTKIAERRHKFLELFLEELNRDLEQSYSMLSQKPY